MGKFYDAIPPNLISWIEKQEMFWVATAPLSADGHVNVSPKGLRDSFHIVNENKVWYQDLTGSGVETISHLRENGRITIMFNAFEGPARIVRLFGTGTVHEFGTPIVDVHKVGSSCGYAVPLYEFKAHRRALIDYAARLEVKDQEYAAELPADADTPNVAQNGIKNYWSKNNVKSIDGIPGLQGAHQSNVTPLSGMQDEVQGVGEPEADKTATGVTNGAAIAASAKGVRGRDQLGLLMAFSAGLAVAAMVIKLQLVGVL
ncbi:hypothetical protein A0H81_00100 [Grifola frondosa]|uniref:Pyridoxamine 5'-phosphate oxidase N-terminal domain-containing protein n=1 Tax=Grifola frondosa TaxID=5627 RepID=A0A1C7MSH3_GRIFR|nr:hypothetical protein A0H81_00100 [Grifola frondosa]